MSIDNVKTVQDIYEAFGRGDAAAIVARATPATRWDFAGGRPDQVPWHRPVEGRDALPEFFGALAQSVEFSCFEPREFVHCGPHVMVDVHLAFTVKATGRTVDLEQIHWWTLDGEGRVARMRHYEDTATVLEAMAG